MSRRVAAAAAAATVVPLPPGGHGGRRGELSRVEGHFSVRRLLSHGVVCLFRPFYLGLREVDWGRGGGEGRGRGKGRRGEEGGGKGQGVKEFL